MLKAERVLSRLNGMLKVERVLSRLNGMLKAERVLSRLNGMLKADWMFKAEWMGGDECGAPADAVSCSDAHGRAA